VKRERFFSKTMDFSEINQLPAALQAVAMYQHLSNGQVLFHRNELSQAIYAVKAGQIRLLHYTRSGQAISHYTVYAGEICAEIALFLDTYTCNAIAEEPTQVLAFPKQEFLNALQQDSNFATAFMMQLSYRLHTTKVMVELRSIRSAQERVLHYLRLLAPPEKNTVVLEQPLKNIASDLGISPEVLSRTLTQLASDGAIAREKRKIILLESSA
jgi:CRP/FNR family transcriptional regulator, dissimilatory nitrate respiration regulator